MDVVLSTARFPACLLLLLWLLSGARLAYAQDYVYWHTLTAEELKLLEQSTQYPPQLVNIAYARAVGRQDMDQGLTLLARLQPELQVPEWLFYGQAVNCLLAVQKGDLTLAQPSCEALREGIADAAYHPSVMAQAYAGLGAWATRSGQPREALAWMDSGLRAATTGSDRNLLAALHHNRSLPLVILGMPDLAVSSLELSRRYHDAVPADSQLPAITMHNLAYVQAQRGAHYSAIEEFRKVIQWAESLGQLSRAYIARTQLAHSLTALERPDEAISELAPWVGRQDFERSPDSHADALRALGEAYLGRADVAAAEQYLQQGLGVARAQNNSVRIQELTLSWVNLLMQEQRYGEAVVELEGLLSTASSQSQLQADALLLMSAAQVQLGDYAQAYDALKRYQVVDSATRAEVFDRRLSALRAASDLDVVNQELAVVREREQIATQRSEQDRINLYVVMFAAALVVVIGILLYRRGLERRKAEAQMVLTRQLQHTVAQRTQEIEAEMALRVAAEKARAKLEQRVAEDERLRTVGQLTGGVAHDFNNLLTVILLSADLLKSGHAEDADNLLEDIIHAGESGRSTTQSLLAYARQQELQPEPLELQDFLQQRTSLFQRTLGDAVKLEVVAPSSARVIADPGQLTTCLINLLFNAREAMNESGLVQIKLATPTQSHVDVIVSDSGPGMNGDTLSRATEPFFTTKDGAAGGSGLGLSMVFGFMKQSGGELKILSCQDDEHTLDQGYGTAVHLTFPLEDQASVANVASVDFSHNSHSGGRTALLIEDQAGVRDVCRVALKRLGFEVIEASSGVEAMEWLLEGSPLDLAITDALMPGGVSGVDVINSLHAVYPKLPAILMSGGAVEPPANCVFLMKPFSLAELEAAVQRLVGEAQVVAFSAKPGSHA